MKFSLYSKKNQLDEMQEQTMRKIESHGFWLLWGSMAALSLVIFLVVWRFHRFAVRRLAEQQKQEQESSDDA